jgi:hypothetical protein
LTNLPLPPLDKEGAPFLDKGRAGDGFVYRRLRVILFIQKRRIETRLLIILLL